MSTKLLAEQFSLKRGQIPAKHTSVLFEKSGQDVKLTIQLTITPDLVGPCDINHACCVFAFKGEHFKTGSNNPTVNLFVDNTGLVSLKSDTFQIDTDGLKVEYGAYIVSANNEEKPAEK